MVTAQERAKLEELVKEIARSAHEKYSPDQVAGLRAVTELRRDPRGRFFIAAKDAPKEVENIAPEYRINVAGIRDIWRYHKSQKYRAQQSNPSYQGPIIVAEGDSWFEYPYARDMLHWIGEDYAEVHPSDEGARILASEMSKGIKKVWDSLAAV